jgi:hypothetical protein
MIPTGVQQSSWLSTTSRCDGLKNVSVEEIIVRYQKSVLPPASG